MEKENIIEALADYEHRRWARWQSYLHSVCIEKEEGTLCIPQEKIERWTKQINTDYSNLSEEEKNADRKGALEIMQIVEKFYKKQ